MIRTVCRVPERFAIWLVAAPLALSASMALANPDFGDARFRLHLQQDAGLAPVPDGWDRPCPTIRGCPLPASWGREWRADNEWVRYVAVCGHPPGADWRADRTPDRKWNTIVQRYRWWVGAHPHRCSPWWAREHQCVIEYLEQDYYNYWYRQRYRTDPPDPRSHRHGFRAQGNMIFRDDPRDGSDAWKDSEGDEF